MSETDEIRVTVAEHAPQSVETRHHLHAHPELSGQEESTARLVAERLRALGLEEVRERVGGYGVIGELTGGAGAGPMLAIRADMDALPIQETSDLPYRSERPGVMHACGHDGHTSTLLGAAAALSELRLKLRGRVRFLFQPAEETVAGARGMCAEGAMQGVDAIVALHGWPGMEVGRIGVRCGPMMASSDTFEITVRGRGGHAAMPHVTVDPILTGARIVTDLQAISAREIAPVDPVVVTVAKFHAGTADNIIPGEATLTGTVRCLRTGVQETMAERVERTVAGVCASARAEYDFRYQRGTPVTVNDERINALVADVGCEALGRDNVVELEAPSMGAEDFSFYLEHAPGAMFRLGTGATMSPLHTPTYNFADGAVPVGMEMFVRLAMRFLNQAAATSSQ